MKQIKLRKGKTSLIMEESTKEEKEKVKDK